MSRENLAGNSKPPQTMHNNGNDREHCAARRLLRLAVRHRDVTSLRKLALDDVQALQTVSDASACSALSFAVRAGYLEVVEALLEAQLEIPDCDVDRADRAGRTALDVALRSWIVASAGARSSSRSEKTAGVAGKGHDVSRRYRILRRLLDAGARRLNSDSLDSVITGVVLGREHIRQGILKKLVKVFCSNGCRHTRSCLLATLFPHDGTSTLLISLLRSHAQLSACLSTDFAIRQHTVPFGNAVILIRAAGERSILARIDRITSVGLDDMARGSGWLDYRLLVCLMTVAGHGLQLHVLNWLYRCHADVYRWVVEYWSSPRPLTHLARVAVRRCLHHPNVFATVEKLEQLPAAIKQFLLLNEFDESICASSFRSGPIRSF